MSLEHEELFSFLTHTRLDVRNQAVEIVSGLSTTPALFNAKVISNLVALTTDDPLTTHSALKALINLSPHFKVDFPDLVNFILIDGNINADLGCMLLSNINPPLTDSDLTRLMAMFTNPTERSNFDFLASVFANASAAGSSFFNDKLKAFWLYTEHPSVIRRGGCISTIKNIALQHAKSSLEITEDLIVYILLPLMASEEYDDDEVSLLPEQLQYLQKERESDARIRAMLMEILLAMGSTKKGREVMRQKGVYAVVKRVHLEERDEVVREHIEDLVDLLQRDEEEE